MNLTRRVRGSLTSKRASHWIHRPWFINTLAAMIVLGIWQYLSTLNARVPSIEDVVSFMIVEGRGDSHGGVAHGELWPPLAISMQRFGIGLAIGLPIGSFCGLLMGVSVRLRALLNDSVLVLLALPAVVWAFAASLWFGFGSTAPIVAVALTAVPFMALNLRSGLTMIDPALTEMSQSFRVPTKRRFLHLWSGSAFPNAVSGVRMAFMTSWNSLLIVEWFGATSGVGWRARFWYDALRFPGFVGWILVFVVIITSFDWLVLRRLERRSVRWRSQPTLTFAENN